MRTDGYLQVAILVQIYIAVFISAALLMDD